MHLESIPPQPRPPLELTIRCGLELVFETTVATPAIVLVRPQSEPEQAIEQERFSLIPRMETSEFRDFHGNGVQRIVLQPGSTTIRLDTLVMVPSLPENQGAQDIVIPVHELPPELLRYTLPSRYCDSDKLLDFAFKHFGAVPHGLARVRAICDWVHKNIEYRFGSGSPHFSASDVIGQRFGVCRDFAHSALALCRCFNLPARYVTGFVPDVAFQDPGTPMDFHAYFQVFLGGKWQTFDARFNVPRVGRVHICYGLDAVDVAFSTLYGAGTLTSFNVWAYQIDPREVSLDDPVDLSKRLDGTVELRTPGREPEAARSFAAIG